MPTLQEAKLFKKRKHFFKALEMRLKNIGGVVPEQNVEQDVTQPPIDMKLVARDVLGLSPDESMEEAVIKVVKGVPQRFVLAGLYALLLEPWYEGFGSDILVVPTDNLKGDNFCKTTSSIYTHLGLSPYEVTNKVMNAGSYRFKKESDDEARALLQEFCKPYNANLLLKLLEKHSVDTSTDLWPWLHVDDKTTSMNSAPFA